MINDRMRGGKFWAPLDLDQAHPQFELEEAKKRRVSREVTWLLDFNTNRFGLGLITVVVFARLGHDVMTRGGRGCRTDGC